MTSLASNAWARLRGALGCDPGRWAAGSAISDPLALLAANRESAAEQEHDRRTSESGRSRE